MEREPCDVVTMILGTVPSWPNPIPTYVHTGGQRKTKSVFVISWLFGSLNPGELDCTFGECFYLNKNSSSGLGPEETVCFSPALTEISPEQWAGRSAQNTSSTVGNGAREQENMFTPGWCWYGLLTSGLPRLTITLRAGGHWS